MADTPLDTVRDYTRHAMALLPQGRAWPRTIGSPLYKLVDAIWAIFADVDAEAEGLIAESMPWRSVHFLSEWEGAFDLPGDCDDAVTTDDDRRDAIQRKMSPPEDQANDAYRAIAADLGYVISIEPYVLSRAGKSVAGDPVRETNWNFGKLIRTTSGANDELLICRIREHTPAHGWARFEFL